MRRFLILAILTVLAPLSAFPQSRDVQTHANQHGRDGVDPTCAETPADGQAPCAQSDGTLNDQILPVTTTTLRFAFSNPAVGATNRLKQLEAPNGVAFSVTRVVAYTDTGTVDFNLDCRARTASGTPGTDVHTSEFQADATSSNTYTTFAGDDQCAANEVLNPSISAVVSATELVISVTIQKL